MISARCVARDLHTIAPGPLECTCWRRFAALWGDCKKSRIAPLNAIIIIIFVYRENAVRSLGLSCIHTVRRSYPPEQGAHIAIRKYWAGLFLVSCFLLWKAHSFIALRLLLDRHGNWRWICGFPLETKKSAPQNKTIRWKEISLSLTLSLSHSHSLSLSLSLSLSPCLSL